MRDYCASKIFLLSLVSECVFFSLETEIRKGLAINFGSVFRL